jgi:GDPmannose 4,6-dehydratase
VVLGIENLPTWEAMPTELEFEAIFRRFGDRHIRYWHDLGHGQIRQNMGFINHERWLDMKKALITGITGQDGSYLAELLLEKGYEVYGLVRRSSTETLERIEHLKDAVTLVSGDLLDEMSLITGCRRSMPDEIYNLAAQSFVHTSWNQPVLTGEFTALGVTRMLDAMRHVCPKARFYQASSSEMYGKVHAIPRTRTPPSTRAAPTRWPRCTATTSPSTTARATSLFAVSGILFNHESPRRGLEFVTRKITDGVARIKLGLQKELRLGNLDAKRDWGFAGDYVAPCG